MNKLTLTCILFAMSPRRFYGAALFLLIGLASAINSSAAIPERIALGIHAPVTPFMWKDGVSLVNSSASGEERKRGVFLEKNLDQIKSWGGTWNIVPVYQWLDGDSNFARLRRVIAEHERRGLEVVFRVIESPEVYGRLTDRETDGQGYDRAYYRWTQTLAREFGSRVKCFLVGNESELDLGDSYHWKSDAPKHLRLTYDQYGKVLYTAVRAIKSVDPDLQVGNSGFSDKSIALAVAQSIYDERGLAEAQAFWEDWKAVGGVEAEGQVGLYRLLRDEDVLRRIEFVRRAAREPLGSDLFQLHYYGGWRGLQSVLDWVGREMRAANAVRPIIAAEVGFRIRSIKRKMEDGKTRFESDWEHYSEQEHATNTVRNFAILAGNGVTRLLYWSMRESGSTGLALRLFPPTDKVDAFPATRVNLAYRALGAALNGARPQPNSSAEGPGFWEYRFSNGEDFSLAWGDVLTSRLQDALQIRDMEGRVVDARRQSEVLRDEPLYLVWPSADGRHPASP